MFCAQPIRQVPWVSLLVGKWRHLAVQLVTRHFKDRWDAVSALQTNDLVFYVNERFTKCMWNRMYDLLEFIAQNLPEGAEEYMAFCNQMLTEECAAYRFVGMKIAEITSGEEIEAIEKGLHDTEPLSAVRAHLARALELYSERPTADYRNSIKESISAVESLACLIAGKPKATLSEALAAIDKQGPVEMHGALRAAFDTLYGYTSDEDGVRHKMLEEGKVSRAEALYMLVACSAFVSYLVSKAIDAGIKLTGG